ncbi:disease resistance protein RPP4 [Artemisia annua]|uniref:Disease resistance protein RPP4 n=1 Tax=Artemisia annua TaxID=35608 RepID=A0A2U1KM24_ARTAN|nr:disease resistance protein RPP4 [Artemisia annua]
MQNPQQLCYVEHPVGIDSQAQDVISALKLTDQACSIVAVLGISGSGKTTIVKAVYNKIAADFDVSSFIENIHCLYMGQNWEVKLQRDAIYCLTAGKNKFKGSGGVAKLIKLLSGQKVFLILDDVYEFKQLQALSIHLASIHDGSRIIVTTRNKLSLSNLPHTPYNIRLLDTIESKYDVFVNYAPEEIGNGFASHLKGALGREGFTICDHTKLPNGQDKSSELLKAIEDSEIYLVVFSPNYASSKECLSKFVLIMDSYPKFKKRKVFPVFFDVEPSHVRNQQGSFFEAFQGHEKNVDAERVQIWRQALKEAGDKSDLNLKDW